MKQINQNQLNLLSTHLHGTYPTTKYNVIQADSLNVMPNSVLIDQGVLLSMPSIGQFLF